MKLRVPPNPPVVGETVKGAVGVEGLVIGAEANTRVLSHEPEELLTGALLRLVVSALRKFHRHELELPLPLVDEIRLEGLEFVQSDKIVLNP